MSSIDVAALSKALNREPAPLLIDVRRREAFLKDTKTIRLRARGGSGASAQRSTASPCPWLIARFVDRDAEFLYVPTKEVRDAAKARDAIPYDIPDVHFSHVGELCSFDAFMKHYRLHDPALEQRALIVRGADTAKLELAPQAPGNA